MDKVTLLELMDQYAEQPPDDVEVDTLRILGEEMLRARNLYDDLAKEAKEAKQAYDKMRLETLPEAMAAAGIVTDTANGSYTLPGGEKVILTNRFYASVKKPDQDGFMDWLREEGHDEIIKESVHPQTLTAFCREQVEAGHPLPPEVSTYTETKASIRK